MPRRSRDELVVIMWRDIPAQVNGGSGNAKQQHVLPVRFQRAIDRAATRAGRKTASEYVAEWRRRIVPLPEGFDGDFAAAIAAEVALIDEVFTADRIRALVDAGGWDPERSAVQ